MSTSDRSINFSSFLKMHPRRKDIRVSWNKENSQLKKIRGLLTKKSKDEPKQIASRFIDYYSQALGKEKTSILEDLKLTQISQSPAGYEIRYQQYVNEVPVFHGRVSLYLTHKGEVYRLNNGYSPTAARMKVKTMLENGIEACEASRIAVEEVKSSSLLDREPPAELTIYKLRQKEHLTWQINVALKSPAQAWMVFVDVCNGQVLEKVPILVR